MRQEGVSQKTGERTVMPMAMTLRERLEKLLNAYSHHYDIARDVSVEGGSFPAAAFYFLRDEHYLVRRDKKFYAIEQYDYTYFYLTENLDAGTLEAQIELSRRAGLGQIKPHKEHMCSYVTLVILADAIAPEAVKRIKRTRFRKNFLFSFHGWMEYRIAAMDCSAARFYSNGDGREVRKTLEQNFKAK